MRSPLPLSEAKTRLSEVADEVARTHERVHVTKNGREYVVLIAAEDLDALEATAELASDPDAQARIVHADDELAAGLGLDVDELAVKMPPRPGT